MELIDFLLSAESARLEVRQQITALRRNAMAIERAALVCRTSTPLMTIPSASLTQFSPPPLLHPKRSLVCSKSPFLQGISNDHSSVGAHHLPTNLPRTSNTIVPSEVALDEHHKQQASLPTDVPTRMNTTCPPHSHRHPKEEYKGLAFPAKLFGILQQAEAEGYDDIISFLPHGKSFMIYKPEKFSQVVMPKYFKTNRLTSFRKQLRLYDFERAKGGRDHGAIFHEFFQRDDQKLVAKIFRRR